MNQSIWSETAAGAGSGASATHALSANNNHVVTSISGHVDADSIVTIKSATTIIWESKIDISVEGFSFSFDGLSVLGVKGEAVSGNIASSSSDCQVNISGYTL